MNSLWDVISFLPPHRGGLSSAQGYPGHTMHTGTSCRCAPNLQSQTLPARIGAALRRCGVCLGLRAAARRGTDAYANAGERGDTRPGKARYTHAPTLRADVLPPRARRETRQCSEWGDNYVYSLQEPRTQLLARARVTTSEHKHTTERDPPAPAGSEGDTFRRGVAGRGGARRGEELKALRKPRGDGAQLGVHFARRGAQDEVAQRVARDLNVLEAAQDADVLVGNDDARARGVLDRELGLAALTRQPPDAARHVLAPQRLLYVLHLFRCGIGARGLGLEAEG